MNEKIAQKILIEEIIRIVELSTLDKDKSGGNISSKLPINGNDIQKAFNIKPGPEFRKLLQVVQDAVDENPNLTKDQALNIVKRELK